MRTDRVGHIDRQRVHIVEGDSDPVVEHLDHIVPHQPRPHEKAVIILRKARPHHSLVIHIVPLGGNGGGKGEAHFASRPVGRAQRLAERVGIGRHIPAAQMRRIVEISIRKGTSVDRGPRGRESRLLAVVLRQEQQQRLVVFQGRNFDARRRKIGPRPERQRDLGRYLPGFIAEGIEVFRRGGGIGIVRLLGILRPRFRHLDASRQQQDRRSGEQRVSYRACFHGTKIGENRTGATRDCKWFRRTFRPVKASLRPRNRANRKYQRLFGAFFFLRTDQPK